MGASKAPAPRTEGKRPPGRPTAYSKAVGARICRKLLEGRSLRSICREPREPALPTVCGWLTDPGHPFSEQYARARQMQAELQADEMTEIADGILNDRPEDTVTVARDRLRVDTRKWIAARMLPKRYGQSVGMELEPGATDGGVTVTMRIVGKDGSEREE